MKDSNNNGDRFIANRTSTNVELGHYQVFNKNTEEDDDVFVSPKTQTFKKAITENLHGNLEEQKIIGYKQKMPETVQCENYCNKNLVTAKNLIFMVLINFYTNYTEGAI